MVDQQNITEDRDDLPSVKGQFWWVTVGNHHLPCLKKSDGTKYVSVRMAEMKVLSYFLNYLNSDVCSCYSVKSFGMTEAEADLLNIINSRHSELTYGHEEFTVNNDFIVKLSDLIEFHAFMKTCYDKLLLRISTKDDRCGFIRINNDSVVPYTLKNNQKYVPLFYFEGETDTLRKKAKQLNAWESAYLKFCCKVQGIKNELFASETCLVTSLDDIKSYFPDGTTFEDYWPSKVNDLQMSKKNNTNSHSWVRAPNNEMVSSNVITSVATAVVPTASVLNKVPNSRIGATINNTNLPSYQSTWPAALGATVPYQQSVNHRTQPQSTFVQSHVQHSQLPTINNNVQSRSYVQQQQQISRPQYYNSHQSNTVLVQQSQVSQPPPLVKVSLTNHITGTYGPNIQTGSFQNNYSNQNGNSLSQLHPMRYTSVTSSAANINNESADKQHQHQRLNMVNTTTNAAGNSYQSRYPPGLTPINGTNSSGVQLSQTSTASTSVNQRKRVSSTVPNQVGSEVIDLCSSPPNSPQLAPVNYANRSQIQTNGCQSTSNRRSWSLLKISEEANISVGNSPMYKIQKTIIKDQCVQTINFKPYNYSELLMTVEDLLKIFFRNVTMSKLQHVLQMVLKINLYAGNSQQIKLLAENGQYMNDVVPLIAVNDVKNFFPHLEYVLNKQTVSETDHTTTVVKKRKAS